MSTLHIKGIWMRVVSDHSLLPSTVRYVMYIMQNVQVGMTDTEMEMGRPCLRQATLNEREAVSNSCSCVGTVNSLYLPPTLSSVSYTHLGVRDI